MKDDLKKLIGDLPSESEFKQRMRFHQAWWRAFVLAEEPGNHPVRKNETLGSTIVNGKNSHKNFLSEKTVDAIDKTIAEREKSNSGILQEDRLFNNLLSSQPLCFNFFGELKLNHIFALKVLKCFYPEFTEVIWVKFEFAPDEKYTSDNSAYDVAFKVKAGDKTGLLGIECKYTDSFSSTEYDKETYRQIFYQSKDTTFIESYEKYITSKFNQLFRNQLIGEALIQNKEEYDFVFNGLFCHQDDRVAQEIATEFQGMLKDGESKFRVITYREYLENMQRLDISWEQRELSMMLWARYCGDKLSKEAFI